jgi:hypothetical protein
MSTAKLLQFRNKKFRLKQVASTPSLAVSRIDSCWSRKFCLRTNHWFRVWKLIRRKNKPLSSFSYCLAVNLVFLALLYRNQSRFFKVVWCSSSKLAIKSQERQLTSSRLSKFHRNCRICKPWNLPRIKSSKRKFTQFKKLNLKSKIKSCSLKS